MYPLNFKIERNQILLFNSATPILKIRCHRGGWEGEGRGKERGKGRGEGKRRGEGGVFVCSFGARSIFDYYHERGNERNFFSELRNTSRKLVAK